MRSMWKGSISFGLVTIPVKLYAATESKDVKFNLLHRECATPIQYRKWCPSCDRQIEAEEITRGYEFERGRYVTVVDEEIEAIPIAAKRTLEIVGFIRLEEIDPVYFEKTYYLEPGEGGAKAYALLRRAMELTGRVAVARVVIRSKESLAALRVFQNGVLAMETMHFPDEVRSVAGLTGIMEPELRPQEIEMATGLIESLAMPFAPDQFENQFRSSLLNLLQAKVQGEEIQRVEPVAQQGRVVDLMEALQASIRAAEAARERGPENPAASAAGPDVAAAAPKAPGLAPAPMATPPTVPGVRPPAPSPAPSVPGLAPIAPSLAPATPGLAPATPGFAPSVPGLAPTAPDLNPTVPGLTPTSPESAAPVPGSAPVPGISPATPDAPPTVPGLSPYPSGLTLAIPFVNPPETRSPTPPQRPLSPPGTDPTPDAPQ